MFQKFSIEKRFFRTLNTYLEPLISTGLGSPGVTPVGAVVLETTGRKSGRTYKTPVLASEFATLLLVSTVRSRWAKAFPFRGDSGAIASRAVFD
jgi:hypothetical protein